MFLQKSSIYHTVDSMFCAYICTWKYFRTILNRLIMNVERLIGNCPECKLSHCLFDKCDKYKSLYYCLESHPELQGKFIHRENLDVRTHFHCSVDEINDVVHLTVGLADLRMFYSMLLALWSQNPDNASVVSYLDFLKPIVKND